MYQKFILFIFLVTFNFIIWPTESNLSKSFVQLSPAQIKTLGNKIWHNECAGSYNGLTSWHKNETFASLGIGHFIWYSKAQESGFSQTFPDLIIYLKNNSVLLPGWLALNVNQECPWKNRTEFYQEFSSKKMVELRDMLASTIDLQTQFIIERAHQALPNLLAHAPAQKKSHIKKQFTRLMATPQGAYALIDYLNFKGEGINTKERYNGKGWGLLQALLDMKEIQTISAPHEFATVTKQLLTNRVAHAPSDKEKQFLPGWLNRINTYTQPI